MPRQPIKAGKYTITERIARGGMGSVYLAKHPTLKRKIILKRLVIRAGSGLVERFRREASLMMDFRNEHIVQVYDHFKEGSSYYIAMEYVEGTSLDKLIQERGFLSTHAAILLLHEICKALKYAHDKGVIHRDIKPANILISNQGEVKLTDFGIATSKESIEEGLTRAGMTLGTPSYMSPEQIADTSKVDNRADIYSVGVVLYEMITGHKPFPSGFTPEALNKINRGIYVHPRKFNPSLPRIFFRIIKHTMNHRIKKRYTDLSEVLKIISRYTKKYRTQEQINQDIKQYIKGEEITLPSGFFLGLKKGKNLIRKVVYAIIALVLLLTAGFFLYKQGYYYEYFKSTEYGTLNIKTTLPGNYYKDPDRVYAVAHLKKHETQEPDLKKSRFIMSPYPEIHNIPLVKELVNLIKLNSDKNEEPKTLHTGKIYLPAGMYDVELYLENQKYFFSFFLYPRSVQKQSAKTYSGKTIHIQFQEPEPTPITINHRVVDSSTGQSLLSKADINFYLQEEEKWIDWKLFKSIFDLSPEFKKYITSDRTYRFTYRVPQYYEQTTTFYVEPGMYSAQITVGMIKKAGTLIIKSNQEGLDLLIDNRKGSFAGGREKRFINYGQTFKGEKKFLLPEGNYILTVKRNKKHQANYQFRIEPEQTTIVEVNYDSENKSINLKEK